MVGAGPAGTMAAHMLAKEGLEVLVLEASGRIGGRVLIDDVSCRNMIQEITVWEPHYKRLAIWDQNILDNEVRGDKEQQAKNNELVKRRFESNDYINKNHMKPILGRGVYFRS